MKVIYPGHIYELDRLDEEPGKHVPSILKFVMRGPHHSPSPGVTCQEVLRAVIDRVRILDAELPHPPNQQIIKHLRMAIALFEARALVRHVEKNDWPIEKAHLGKDGHLDISIED